MFIKLLCLLLFGLFAIAFGDSATQTDWSGGDGVIGPVIDWGTGFYVAKNIGAKLNPSVVVLSPLEHIVDGDFYGANSVHAADINGDGHIDVLGGAQYPHGISWWENSDTSPGIVWTQHIIESEIWALSVYPADINGDGYMDVLGAIKNDRMYWWENLDGSGTNWEEHFFYYYSKSAHAADINGDGQLDVLRADWFQDLITWIENEDGSGTSWTEHTIDGDFDGALSASSGDVNGDGHMDVLGAGYSAGEITWWENEDGSGTSWTEHTVEHNFSGAMSVQVADVNGDGHMDILGVANIDDNAWWENLGGTGTNWTKHTIDADFSGALSVNTADVNGDGHIDILGAGFYPDISWWENSDTSPGIVWTQHVIDEQIDCAQSAYAADVNEDGHMDILGAAFYTCITWWDLVEFSSDGFLESSCLYLQNDPEWGFFDWTVQEPEGTAVYFQVRSCDSPDIASMGAWSDPLYTPCSLLELLADGDSYFQYKAILQTSDPTLTPILEDVTVTWNSVGIRETTVPIYQEVKLISITPNPSAGAPVISFELPEETQVGVYVFDLSGRLVSEFVETEYPSGRTILYLKDLNPGIYFCRMISEDFASIQRFVVIE